jgi:hypothetical protein
MGMAFYKPQGISMTHVAPIDKENEAHFLNMGKPSRSAFTKIAFLPIGHGLNCCKLLPSWLLPLYINTWMHSFIQKVLRNMYCTKCSFTYMWGFSYSNWKSAIDECDM